MQPNGRHQGRADATPGKSRHDTYKEQTQLAYVQDLLPSLLVGQVTEDAAAKAAQDCFVQVLRPVCCTQDHHLYVLQT